MPHYVFGTTSIVSVRGLIPSDYTRGGKENTNEEKMKSVGFFVSLGVFSNRMSVAPFLFCVTSFMKLPRDAPRRVCDNLLSLFDTRTGD